MWTEKKLWAEKCDGQDEYFLPLPVIDKVQDEKLVCNYTLILINTKLADFLAEFHYF